VWGFLGVHSDPMKLSPPMCFIIFVCTLVNVILLSIYTADLASFLVEKRLAGGRYQSVDDLGGLVVYTYPEYTAPLLQAYSITTVPLGPTWDDLIGAVDRLLAGDVHAVLGDASLLVEALTRKKLCSLNMLSQSFVFPIKYSFAAFSGNAAASLLIKTKISQTISLLSGNGFLDKTFSHITQATKWCGRRTGSDSIDIGDVWGLFLILGASVVVAIMWGTCLMWWKRCKARDTRNIQVVVNSS
jgi:hypothetical protein